MKLLQYGTMNLMRIGAYAIRRDEIIAVRIGKDGENYKAWVWQQGQSLNDRALEIHISKEEYKSLQADWGVPSIA